MLLAGAGMKVTVLERQPHVGGRTTTLEGGGFRFDAGPTFFLYPQVLRDIFSAVGFDLGREVPMVRLDPQYRLAFGGGGEILATPDVEKMERAVSALSPQDGPAFRRFLEGNREKFERFRPCIEAPFLGWKDVLSPEILKLLPVIKPWRSLERDLASYFADPRIRLAFSFQSKYLGMSPFRCPSLFSILSYLEYEYGVFHPIGGCGAISTAMARVARDLGVDIRLGEPVREILFEGRRAVGARTDQGVYRSDAMVVNADFARAMTRLVPDHLRRRWTDRRLEKKKFSCSTFMLYLGVEGLYEDVPHHTIYISKDYERNLDEIENRHVLSDDPSFYVQNPGVTDSTLAPRGMSTLYVLVPVTHQHPNVDWRRERDRYRALALSKLESIGLGGVEERIRYERVLTPQDWDEGFEIHRGATFNLAHNLGQMLHFRPRNRFEDVDGMYLVGGGTHPGSGLPVIFQSALISSRLLLRDLGFGTQWVPRTARSLEETEAEPWAEAV
jgi:phytoene desaturase